MASSKRETQSAVSVTGTSRLALFTLVAVIGFTPWLWNAAMPWGVFAFRFTGLAALLAVSVAQARGTVEQNVWSARVALLAIGVVVLAGASAIVSVHPGKSLEAMLNLLAILGLFLATLYFVRGSGAGFAEPPQRPPVDQPHLFEVGQVNGVVDVPERIAIAKANLEAV